MTCLMTDMSLFADLLYNMTAKESNCDSDDFFCVLEEIYFCFVIVLGSIQCLKYFDLKCSELYISKLLEIL